jgi:hypothetical protein
MSRSWWTLYFKLSGRPGPSSTTSPSRSNVTSTSSRTRRAAATTSGGGGQPIPDEEEPPSYESLIVQQQIVEVENQDSPDGKPPAKDWFKKRATWFFMILLIFTFLGVVGFLINYWRADNIHSEIKDIKHNHIASLASQTADLDDRADNMEQMVKQMLRKIENLHNEIKRLKGEAENADELRRLDSDYDLTSLYTSSANTQHNIPLCIIIILTVTFSTYL